MEKTVIHLIAPEKLRKYFRLDASYHPYEWVRDEWDFILRFTIDNNRHPAKDGKPLLLIATPSPILVEGRQPSLQFVNEYTDSMRSPRQ